MIVTTIKPIVVGVVGHVFPEHLADFKQLLEDYPHFRLVIFKESDAKLWLVSQEGNND
jgi:hypothetical protein